jgi:hypothetical protein
VIAISTCPSEAKSRLDRVSFLRFVTAFAVAIATIASLVRTLVDSSACICVGAIFDSSAAARTAETDRAVSESKLLLKCRRDGRRTFVAGIPPAGDRGGRREQAQRHSSTHGAKVRTERESAVCPRGGSSCG